MRSATPSIGRHNCFFNQVSATGIEVIAERTTRDPDTNHYDDREREIVSLKDIDIDDQIDSIDAALNLAA